MIFSEILQESLQSEKEIIRFVDEALIPYYAQYALRLYNYSIKHKMRWGVPEPIPADLRNVADVMNFNTLDPTLYAMLHDFSNSHVILTPDDTRNLNGYFRATRDGGGHITVLRVGTEARPFLGLKKSDKINYLKTNVRTTLIHELQHFHDSVRSKGKYQNMDNYTPYPEKNNPNFDNDNIKYGTQNIEVNARFTETMAELNDMKTTLSWVDFWKLFKKSINYWENLNKKQQDRLKNRVWKHYQDKGEKTHLQRTNDFMEGIFQYIFQHENPINSFKIDPSNKDLFGNLNEVKNEMKKIIQEIITRKIKPASNYGKAKSLEQKAANLLQLGFTIYKYSIKNRAVDPATWEPIFQAQHQKWLKVFQDLNMTEKDMLSVMKIILPTIK